MGTTLEPLLSELGLTTPQAQFSFVKLLHASGAYGDIGAPAILSDKQAEAILRHVRFKDTDTALDWLHNATQERWLRPAGKERWESPEPEFAITNREALLPLLEQTGIVNEVAPSLKHYQHALVLGATESAVDDRIETLKRAWESGVRFDRVVLLGSDRPLVANMEPSSATLTERTETGMMEKKIHDAFASGFLPKEMLNVPIISIKTPMRANGRRPNTQDTAAQWLTTKPVPGNVLAISNQPFAAYQDAALESVLPQEFRVETVGSAATPANLKIANALDSTAREIDVGMEQIRARLKKREARKHQLEQVFMVQPETLKTDPELQYRLKVNNHGVTDSNRWSGQRHPLVAGMLLAFENKKGELFVVDGHHRVDEAKRRHAAGEEVAAMPARIMREIDGFTKDDARVAGAVVNFIQSDKRDLKDAAKVFHDIRYGKVHMELLPTLKMDADLTLAYHAGGLSEQAFTYVQNGKVPVEVAAEIAQKIAEPERQVGSMRNAAYTLKNQPKEEPEEAIWVDRVGGQPSQRLKIELNDGNKLIYERFSNDGGAAFTR